MLKKKFFSARAFFVIQLELFEILVKETGFFPLFSSSQLFVI
jgi:hypothetical protein